MANKTEKVAKQHDCLYGITKDGKLITEDTFNEWDIGFPFFISEEGINRIGLMQHWFEKSRKLATFYTYCPHCGRKLNIRKLSSIAKGIDDRY